MRCRILLTCILSFFLSFAYASPDPVPMLEKTANRMIKELRRNQGNLRGNNRIAFDIVNRILIPQVDVRLMSRSVIKPNVWRQASSKQRSEFTREFTRLVTRTYSGALTEYSNETVRFHPIRGGYEGKRRLTVHSTIKRQGARNIQISYRLFLRGNHWKIYDMSVAGVSILQSYRSQFSSELSKGTFDNLITKLRNHHRRL